MRTGLPYRELEVQLFYLTESNMYIHGLTLPNMRTSLPFLEVHSILFHSESNRYRLPYQVFKKQKGLPYWKYKAYLV